MSDYWKTYYESNSKRFRGSLLKQVGKTVNGRQISGLQLELLVDSVVRNLRLSHDDHLFDLCCGNGLITRRLAPLVKHIVAVDFAPGLIDSATRHSSSQNVDYIVADVLGLDATHFVGLKKVLMYEALQHFSVEQLSSLLDLVRDLQSGSLALFGSIPDRARLTAYYDTEEKMAFYMRSERQGKPHMGRWWLMDEIERLASAHSFKAKFIPQAPSLYTAYYRFDVLLEKSK